MRFVNSFLLLVLFLPAICQAKSPIKFEYSTDLSIENLHYVFNRADHDINDQINGEVTLGLLYDNTTNFLLNIKPRVRIDGLDFNRNRYLPNEAYFKFYNPHVELSAGFQVVSWGVSRSFNPTNVINRPDLEGNYYRPSPLGDLLGRLKFTFSTTGAISELGLDFLVAPVFLETPLPKSNSRFAISGDVGGAAFTSSEVQDIPEYPKAMSAAFMASAVVKATDIKLHFYHGPERTPAYYLLLDENLDLVAQPFYYTIDVIGLNVESVIKSFTFHVEGAFKTTRFNEELRHELPLTDTSDAIPSDYLQYVGGVDYTLNNVFGSGTLIFALEYLGENERSLDFEEFRPLKNDLFAGVRLLLNDVRLTQIEVACLKDLANSEMIILAEGSTSIYRELKLTLGGMVVNQDSNPDMPLSFFDNNTYVYSKLSYSFGGSFLKKKAAP